MNIEITKNKPIYLDNQATTPIDPRVLEAMLPYFERKFGNPHSSGHYYGWEASEAVELAREQIADFICADPDEIFFTSGATESNNTAVKGVARFYKARRNHIITCVTEHMCILDSAFQLEKEGFEVTYLNVKSDGLIDLIELEKLITKQTILVSIMTAQNEIGTIQPIAEIGEICRENKIFFHTDAAQAIGKIPVNVKDMKVDLLSLTAHKIYGPMGVGALYVGKNPRTQLEPLFNGGGQEGGLRSGTLSPPLCVGLGQALVIAKSEMADESARLTLYRDKVWKQISRKITGLHLNGTADNRLPGNLNFSIEDVDIESLMASIPDLAFSTGSACTSASEESSHVLKAIGLSNRLADSSLRLGFGRFNTDEEISYAADRLVTEINNLRNRREIIVAAE